MDLVQGMIFIIYGVVIARMLFMLLVMRSDIKTLKLSLAWLQGQKEAKARETRKQSFTTKDGSARVTSLFPDGKNH